MKDERNGILLLEDVARQVTDLRGRELAMFGRRDFITIGSVPYDFVFHYIRLIPVKRLNPEPYLVIPVLSLESPEQLDNAKIQMHKLSQRNRSITTFALRHNKKGNISLRFFNADPVRIGTEIMEKTVYRIASEEEFRDFCKNKWDDFARKLLDLRNNINTQYSY